jgi:hypothetical protein
LAQFLASIAIFVDQGDWAEPPQYPKWCKRPNRPEPIWRQFYALEHELRSLWHFMSEFEGFEDDGLGSSIDIFARKLQVRLFQSFRQGYLL